MDVVVVANHEGKGSTTKNGVSTSGWNCCSVLV